MKDVTIIGGDFSTALPLQETPCIMAGFPSPSADYMKSPIDFNKDMIPHPETTFYARVKGDSMIDAGIDEGDLLIVDRSVEAQNGDIIIAFVNNEFTVKYLDTTHKSDGYIELVPANKQYPRIQLYEEDHPMVWGVVIWTLRKRHQ